MTHYGSTPTLTPRRVAATASSARRRRGSAALVAVFVVLCCLSYASVQSQLPAQPSALEEQALLAPVAPLKISFDAKIGGAALVTRTIYNRNFVTFRRCRPRDSPRHFRPEQRQGLWKC
jgi:hypothetical protein